MGLFMIDENKLLAWLQDEYVKFSRDELREYNEYIYRYLRGKMDLIQDLLIEIKQGQLLTCTLVIFCRSLQLMSGPQRWATLTTN